MADSLPQLLIYALPLWALLTVGALAWQNLAGRSAEGPDGWGDPFDLHADGSD